MSRLVGRAVGQARATQASQGHYTTTPSYGLTGIGHRVNPATGDRGPDSPRNQDRDRDRDGPPGRRRRGQPRGRQRRLGGDVRSPLSA